MTATAAKFAVDQTWTTNGGETAVIVDVLPDEIHVKIGKRGFMNILDTNGHDMCMGAEARDALVALAN